MWFKLHLRLMKFKIGNKKLIENVGALYFIQLVSYILPLVSLPYLFRVLGSTNYGIMAFSQSFIAYFQIFVDYGFNFSATRSLTRILSNSKKVNRYITTIYAAKIFLFFISTVILCVIISILHQTFHNDQVIIYSYFVVLGNVFSPTWIFQAYQNMKPIAVITLLTRLVFTLFIFSFVHSSQNLYLAILLTAGTNVVISLVGMFAMHYYLGLNFSRTSSSRVIIALKEGFTLFLSSSATTLYAIGNTFILGLLSGYQIAGEYNIVEKIIKAIVGLLNPLMLGLFPHSNSVANKNKLEIIRFGKKLTLWISFLTLPISFIVLIFSSLFVKVYLGNNFINAINTMRMISFLPFFIGISNVLGLQIMLPLQKDKEFSYILLSGGLINVFLNIVLDRSFGSFGTAISVESAELFIAGIMFIYLVRFYGKLIENK